MFMLNGIIVMLSGVYFLMGERLVQIISIFAMSYVVDMFAYKPSKVTALIITTKAESVGKNISKTCVSRYDIVAICRRGILRIPGNMIMMVVTRYEIYDLEQAVLEADEIHLSTLFRLNRSQDVLQPDDEQRTFKTTESFQN